MDCERVFGVLVSGPFPTGEASDSEVERHLLGCASCREIAEALRPCDDQFHEALPAIERRHLPRYRRAVVSTVGATPATGSTSPLAVSPAIRGQADWRQSDRWRWELSTAEMNFRHTTHRAGLTSVQRRLLEFVSLAALTTAVAISGWGLGWLML